jgi:hypothetical protein
MRLVAERPHGGDAHTVPTVDEPDTDTDTSQEMMENYGRDMILLLDHREDVDMAMSHTPDRLYSGEDTDRVASVVVFVS